MTTKAEKKYMNRVAELPCVLCGEHGVQLHHLREGEGMAQRAQNWLVMALCPACHTGSTGFHGNRNRLRAQKLDEIDLLARTIEALNS
jgi:hypothetical protein